MSNYDHEKNRTDSINEVNISEEEVKAADLQMRDLFIKRMIGLHKIANWKKERGLPIEDNEQESQLLTQLSSSIEDDAIRSYYICFLKDVLKVSRQWQHHLMDGMRVAYSGVEGAFAHIAAMHIFPDAAAIPYPTFEDAYHKVEEGVCDIAVLPIENSYAGEVGQVLDLMLSGSLYVNGVYDLPVTQNLLGLPGAKAEEIKTVVSHPQALSQCSPYIRKHGYMTRSASNTASAAKEVAAGKDPTVGAIASAYTAQLYGLCLLDRNINESRMNTTRFAVFSRVESHHLTRQDKSSFLILFTVKDEVGGLAKAVNMISAYNFNMRVLRSRPMHNLPWNYYFYAEIEGNDNSENGQRMLTALRGVCPILKVVGRYTTADTTLEEGEELI